MIHPVVCPIVTIPATPAATAAHAVHLVAVATVPVMLSNLTTSYNIFCNNIAVHSGNKEKSRRGQFVHVNSAQRTEFFPREPVSTTAVGAPSSAQNGVGKISGMSCRNRYLKGSG